MNIVLGQYSDCMRTLWYMDEDVMTDLYISCWEESRLPVQLSVVPVLIHLLPEQDNVTLLEAQVSETSKIYLKMKWNEWCFRPWFCICKAILCRVQPALMGWGLLWIIPLVHDRSLDLLTSSPARYHCTTNAPRFFEKECTMMVVMTYPRFRINHQTCWSAVQWATGVLWLLPSC